MNTWMANATLWADMQLFRGMGSGFRGKRAEFTGGDIVAWIVIIAVVVAAFAVLSRFLSRQERNKRYHNSKSLFRQLCQVHGLSRQESRCLKRLAAERLLDQPAMLFFEAELFDTETLGPEWNNSLNLVTSLKSRVFHVPEVADAEAVSA